MDPNNLPLEPLIAPPDVSYWPLAPLWWIIFFLSIAVAVAIFYAIYRRMIRKPSISSLIKDRISYFTPPYGQTCEQWLQLLNLDLKRVALADYPEIRSQSMTGAAWVDFLCKTSPTVNRHALETLVADQYKKELYLDDKTLDDIHMSVLLWVSHHD